jgi:hypothetical protein
MNGDRGCVLCSPGLGTQGPRAKISSRLPDGESGAEGTGPTRVAQPP